MRMGWIFRPRCWGEALGIGIGWIKYRRYGRGARYRALNPGLITDGQATIDGIGHHLELLTFYRLGAYQKKVGLRVP